MSNAFKSVLASGGGVQVDNLVITTPATKLTFNVGEMFNITGLAITATIGSLVGDVTQDCTVSPAVGTLFTEDDLGNKNIVISYGNRSITYSIYVRNGIEIKPWATATEAQLAEMLAAHYAGDIDLHNAEGWEIGAERDVALSAIDSNAGGYGLESHRAKTVKFVLMNKGGKKLASDGVTDCAFVVGCKSTFDIDPWTYEGGIIGRYQPISQTGRWSSSSRRGWLNDVFKSSISSDNFRTLFKEFVNSESNSTTYSINDYFSYASMYEILGTWSYGEAQSYPTDDIQFEFYKTPSNRIKYNLSTQYPQAQTYWTRSRAQVSPYYFCYITDGGGAHRTDCEAAYGISPFGVI